MITSDEQEQLPPDHPSSSVNQNHQQKQQVFHTVSDIDLIKPTDANLDDTNNPLPKFSIRDYVFESRCKDIARNWPFSSKSLQLCMNYGVKNLLPPFQSLDSVRNYSSVSICTVENHSPNEESVRNIDSERKDNTQCHLEEDLALTKSKSQPAVKKCKLVMKLNLGIESIEETVASKVCPVCKTFSSSSNTTLNAHIDSCLSEESSMKVTTNLKLKTVKHRIKPRKMRLMVDIYKAAPHCTIEELDRRNGTNWATNSSFPDQELDFQAEEKEKEPQEPTMIPEVANHEAAVYIDKNGKKKKEPRKPTIIPEVANLEGAVSIDKNDDKRKELQEPIIIPEVANHEDVVYIDKNGKKVRILSTPKSCNLDADEAQVLHKGRKGSKVVIKKKKKKVYGPKNGNKILKPSPNSRKLSKKAETRHKENVTNKETCKEVDGGEKTIKTGINKQRDDLVITRPPWACSRRTGAAKKRFPLCTKRKEGTCMDDRYENPNRPKESMFPSLKKNLSMPAGREHNAGSKLINLKRKFQDSFKQKSRKEEDMCKKISSEMVNVMEVKRKESITSKSSNDDSCSPELEISSESDGTEDCVGIEPGFMCLQNTLNMNNEFSVMISEQDNKFDSQQRTLHDFIMEHNTEKQENYFNEVDPIPIPGPPGSFLPPSPGADMGSEEEPQGNSSLTTMSRVHSSEDHRHHDMIMNQDFISGSSVSTVSSPSFARSTVKLSARFDKYSVNNNNNNNSSDLRSVDAIFNEKGNEKSSIPCCCSRKEGAFFKNLASCPQETAFSKERATESNRLRSELFPLPNHLTLPPRDPMVKSPAVSPTTPVLRLMGKNLTVVNTDDQQVKPPCSSPMGQYQQLQNQTLFSHNQNDSMTQSQCLNLYPPNYSTSYSDLRSANLDINASKEVIVIDDSSENEGDDHHHMFKVPMIRNNAFSFANPYGSLGRWSSTAYYPPGFS